MTTEEKRKITELRKVGISYSKIADSLNLSRDTVKTFCRRNGLCQTTSAPLCAMDLCKECGSPILQKEKMKKRLFCCDDCRRSWYRKHPENINRKRTVLIKCVACGKEFSAYPKAKRKYCSHACYISARFGGEADA